MTTPDDGREVVEIVARALWEKDYPARTRHIKEWDQLAPGTQRIWKARARTILSALSSKGLAVVPVEPTEAMQDAGGSSIIRPSIYMGGTPPGAKRRARDVWADMLAAAPKEGQDAILKAALKSESELMPNPRFARPKEGQGA